MPLHELSHSFEYTFKILSDPEYNYITGLYYRDSTFTLVRKNSLENILVGAKNCRICKCPNYIPEDRRLLLT